MPVDNFGLTVNNQPRYQGTNSFVSGTNEIIRERVITEAFIPINAPPLVDAGLLSRIPLQERGMANGDQFRVSLNKLEDLEKEEDIRLQNILGGLGDLRGNALNGAPDVLRRMIDYCTELR